METNLFKEELSPFALELKQAVSKLQDFHVDIGTSSWKYEGWLDQLYRREYYYTRNQFSENKFQQHCLEEYARIFNTVCVDAGYYSFPRRDSVHRMVDQTQENFRFSFKVTDEITTKQFPKLERHGAKGGQLNPHYLNADLFLTYFLGPLAEVKKNIGVLMFEFSKFKPHQYERGRDFINDLDTFLGKLPKDWDYGVEIRNDSFLHPEYFRVLQKHQVTHVYNSWTQMPSIEKQFEVFPDNTADFYASRLLLKPGRDYESAVKKFAPYTKIQEIQEEVREDAVKLIKRAKKKKKKSVLYVNNRLEGHSPSTIIGIAQKLD
jgi:uncharacterized protein YecE (DUF72 family)